MKDLLKINYGGSKKTLCMDLLFPNLILLLVFIVYKLKKTIFLTVSAVIKGLPDEIQVLFGIGLDTEAGSCNFFLFYTAMILLCWFAWKTIIITVSIFGEMESSGRIYRMCNQLYTKKDIFNLLFRKAIVECYVRYVPWSLLFLIVTLMSSINQLQRKNIFFMWGKMIGIGMLIITLYILIVLLFCTKRKKTLSPESFGYKIVVFPLILSNLHKIIGIVIWGSEFIKKGILPVEKCKTIQLVLLKLYWISPLSWCNPFMEESNMATLIQIVICSILIIVVFIRSRYLYGNRDFLLP